MTYTMSNRILSCCPYRKIESLMGRCTKSLTTDSHHQKGIFSDEAHESFETSQTASRASDAIISTCASCGVTRNGLIFGKVM
jgi:hypothetical protein